MAELPDDFVEFSLLEEYLERVQAGQNPDWEEFLRKHPELESALRCIDTLEGIAPSAERNTLDDTEEFALPPLGSRLPRDFGSYELLEEIGRGGMGVVYKARQKGLDRPVAIKMILASHLASPEHVQRFQVEAKAAAQAQHPHIVHIHDVGRLHDQHYFVMQYVEGISLAKRVARGPIEIKAAVHLVERVAKAVAHLHQHGIVHRDLKPSNVLLDAEENPYVADFGLAKVFGGDSKTTTTGVIVGTPSYMAPEQAAGRHADVGPACDVYSLGAILYELLTGRPPFREDTPIDTVMRVLSAEPPLPRTINRRIPRALELICLRCLAKSPGDRYASAQALADDLERYLKGEPLDARPPHPVQRFLRWTRREPALAARLAVLGIFFVVENANYYAGIVDWDFHKSMLILEGVWAVVTVGFQVFLKSGRWAIPARFIWGTFDSAMLLAALLIASGAASPLLVLYPMLIVLSGLWLRERFVWFMTVLSLISYGLLMFDYYIWRHAELQADSVDRPDRHVIFVIALVSIAWGVANLVHRIRALSSYYGQRR